jgi:hypothetical protein
MGLISTLFPNRKKKMFRKIDNAIDQVKHGTYNYLFTDYVERFERDFAGKLSASVVNELFSEKPVDAAGEMFLSDNRKTVEEELVKVAAYEGPAKMVAEAVLLKSTIIFSHLKSGDYDKNTGKAILRLKKLGIIQGEHKTRSTAAFIAAAGKYFGKSLKKVKYL